MNGKNLGILAGVTIFFVLVAALVNRQGPSQPEAFGEKLFPGLMAQVDQVDQVVLATADETFTLAKQEDQWGLQDRDQYPADEQKIAKMIVGMAELTTVERKTSNPERYAKIGVEDTSEQDAKSVRVTLKKGADTLADLLVGNERASKVDPTRREVYARKPSEEQAWLAAGGLSIGGDKKRAAWLNKEIVDLPRDEVREVEVTHADGEVVRIFRERRDTSDFTLDGIPEGKELSGAYMLNNLAGFLAKLQLEDVKKAPAPTEGDRTVAKFTTFDGRLITLTLQEQEGNTHAWLSATFNRDQLLAPAKETKDPVDTTPEAEQKAEAEYQAKLEKMATEAEANAKALAAKTAGWVYQLTSWKAANLTKKMADLTKDKTPPQDSTGNSGSVPALLPNFDPASVIENLGK